MVVSILSTILAFLQAYGYHAIFPLMFLELTGVTYVAAFAASQGFFNIYFVWLLSVLASTLLDLMWFLIGRFGSKTSVYSYFINKIGAVKMNRIETYLIDNPAKTIAVIKLTPSLPIPGLILCGAIKVPFKKYFLYTSLIVLAYSSLLVTLGYYSGIAFEQASRYIKYGQILIALTIIIIIVAAVLLRKAEKKISSKIERI